MTDTKTRRPGRPRKNPPSAPLASASTEDERQAVDINADRGDGVGMLADASGGNMMSPMMARMSQLQAMGLPEGAIMAALNSEFGGGDAPTPAPTPGAPQGVGELGPDPQMVAAYHERMKTYVKPVLTMSVCSLDREDKALGDKIAAGLTAAHKAQGQTPSLAQCVNAILDELDGFGGFTVRRMFYDWFQRWKAWQSVLRKLPDGQQLSDQEVASMLLKHHWHTHPVERAMLQAAKVGGSMSTGPAKTFNANAGEWKA